MTIQTVTYSSENAKPSEKWIAYVVLPNDEYWLVRCTGETEQVAVTKVVTLWERETASKYKVPEDEPVKATSEDTWNELAKPSGRGAHFIGKVWLINIDTREKVRVEAAMADAMLAAGGWQRGGPRSR